MAKEKANVLVGVATLAVRDENALAEWDKTYKEAGSYSAKLYKKGAGSPGSTHVQFVPAAADQVTWAAFSVAILTDLLTYRFFERTSGGAHYWSQVELRFEQADGDGWFELTLVPHQAQIWSALVFSQYTLEGDVTTGAAGGQTPDGSSVFTWGAGLQDLDTLVAQACEADSVGAAFEAAETGSGLGCNAYVLKRVRVELWEEAPERTSWIDNVTINGTTYAIEPGGATPDLVLSSPNVEIGYTEDGVIFEYTADEADIEVEEETVAIDRVITKETIAVTCNMAEASLFNMDKAMAGAVLSGNVLELGGGVNKKLNLTIEGLTPLGFKRVIYIPKATATGAVGMPYKKGEKTVVPVTFQALKSDEPAVTVVDAAA